MVDLHRLHQPEQSLPRGQLPLTEDRSIGRRDCWIWITNIHGRILRVQPNQDVSRRPRSLPKELLLVKVMSFELKNAGATFQRMVTKMFASKIGRNMKVYVDVRHVKSYTTELHEEDLAEAFQVIKDNDMKLNPAKCIFRVSSGKFLGFIVHQRGMEANPKKIRAILDMKSPTNLKQLQSLNGKVAALNRFVSKSTEKCCRSSGSLGRKGSSSGRVNVSRLSSGLKFTWRMHTSFPSQTHEMTYTCT